MSTPEKPFDALLQTQFDYLTLLKAADPSNPNGLAPDAEEFAEWPPIREGIGKTFSELYSLVHHQIYVLGRGQYVELGLPNSNLCDDRQERRATRANLLAVMTMPDNHAERMRRAGVFTSVLETLRYGTKPNSSPLFIRVANIRPGSTVDTTRRMYAVPDAAPPHGADSLRVSYDEPLPADSRASQLAFSLSYAKVIEAARHHQLVPDNVS